MPPFHIDGIHGREGRFTRGRRRRSSARAIGPQIGPKIKIAH
jgi:hypothetical protein